MYVCMSIYIKFVCVCVCVFSVHIYRCEFISPV